MEFTHHDQVALYKKFEVDLNKKIHNLCNTVSFFHACSTMMEHHLDQVMIHRKLINDWLSSIDIPNKDEIAELANRKISCESKLDLLEESIYWENQLQKMKIVHVKNVRKELEELLGAIREEVTSSGFIN